MTAASAPLLGEIISLKRWMAVLFGFLGVIIILRPGIGVFDPIALIPLGVAVMFSAYTILTKVISRDDTNETTLFYTGIVGLVALSLLGRFFGLTHPWSTGFASFGCLIWFTRARIYYHGAAFGAC